MQNENQENQENQNVNNENEFERREHGYANTMGELLGAFTSHIVEADTQSKNAALQRIETLLAGENIRFAATTKLVGLDQELETKVSVPRITIGPINPVIIDSATIKTSMTVSATQESQTTVNASAGVETAANFGIPGLGGGSVKINAQTSVESSQKRQDDYTSTCEVEVTMKQGDPPEGLMKIIDALNETTAKGLELNGRIIEVQATRLMNQVDANPQLSTGGDATAAAQ